MINLEVIFKWDCDNSQQQNHKNNQTFKISFHCNINIFQKIFSAFSIKMERKKK